MGVAGGKGGDDDSIVQPSATNTRRNSF